jgi:hypothetical protein
MQPESNFPISDASRREFLKTVSAGAALAATGGLSAALHAAEAKPTATPENLVAELYKTLNEQQREKICFGWDYVDPTRGLLRTRTANNWQITEPSVNSDFFNSRQQEIIRNVFEGIIAPDWHARFDQQMQDDAGGWGDQSIALFGEPGSGKFEFVLTGRHMTLRCDGDSADHVAFGGPIFYGHAPEDDETQEHEGNVFWPQALAANNVYKMLDGKQREKARVAKTPREQLVAFQGKHGDFPGIPVADLSSDQKEHVQKTLQTLVEMYRQSDRDEVVACLKR